MSILGRTFFDLPPSIIEETLRSCHFVKAFEQVENLTLEMAPLLEKK